MAKLTTNDLTSFGNEASAIQTINNNFAAVETALENTLSRDGTTPNTMEANLDMNDNRILNLPAAVAATEPVRKAEFEQAVIGSYEVLKSSFDTYLDFSAYIVDASINLVQTGGYYSLGDGGGAQYERSSTVTPFVSGDGAYWRYIPQAGKYNVLAFGAQGNGVNDTTTQTRNNDAFSRSVAQALAEGGGTIVIPPGAYNYTQTLSIDTTTITTGIEGTGWISVEGAGAGQTKLDFRSTTTGARALEFIGASMGSGGGIRGCLAKGLVISGPSSLIASGNSVGLYIEQQRVDAYVEDLKILEFYYGVYLKDVIGLDHYSCHYTFNNYGLYCDPTFTISPVNEMAFFGCHIGNNRQYGAYFYRSAPTSFFGGSFEGNGQPGAWTSDTDRFDVMFENCGYNGAVSAAFYGVHFESSGGAACIWIKHDSTPTVYKVDGCDFIRNGIQPEQSTNCIRFDTTGASQAILAVHGSGFYEVNGYTPTTSQRYIAEGSVSGTQHKYEIGPGNMFANWTAIPDLPNSFMRTESDQYVRLIDVYNDGTFQSTVFERYDFTTGTWRYGTFAAKDLALVRGNAERLQIKANLTQFPDGGLAVNSAVLSTSATDGFLYLPTCAGAPTGVPTNVTGCKAAVYDTTNDRLYVYNGAWKSVLLT